MRHLKRHVFFPIAVPLFAVGIVIGSATPAMPQESPPPAIAVARDPAALRQDMRQLWSERTISFRQDIVYPAADFPEQRPRMKSLIENQRAVGEVVTPFYGEAVGDRLAYLLQDQLAIMARLSIALGTEDSAAFYREKDNLHANADEVAALLSDADPKAWPLAGTTLLLQSHAELMLADAVAYVGSGDSAASAATWQRLYDSSQSLADRLSDALIGRSRQEREAAPPT